MRGVNLSKRRKIGHVVVFEVMCDLYTRECGVVFVAKFVVHRGFKLKVTQACHSQQRVQSPPSFIMRVIMISQTFMTHQAICTHD